MRKLYALLAGFVISLACINSANARNVTPDVANFTFTIDAPNNNVFFVNTSTIGSEPGPRKAFWNFGDGNIQMTGALDNTQHHYQVAGTYNVCLKIYRYRSNTGDSVLMAYACKTLVIQTVCNADFVTLSVASNPLLKYFVAQPSHNQNKKPVKVCWQFGDGRDTCINYPTTYTGVYAVSHLYAHPGNYNVCISILYDGGCQAYKCHSVQVGDPDTCSADFERIQSTGANPLLAYFKALPQHNNNRKPSRVCWIFGDGRDTCINYSETYTGQYVVSHLYAQPGQYQVCVNIRYYGGCEASKCKPIQIGNPDSCRADFERLPATANNPLRVYFRALPWHNNNKKPQRICWRFGDGQDTCINYPNAYTGQYVVVHNYQHNGLYEVCVNILYVGGCEAHKCKPIQVGERPDSCRADFERLPSPTADPRRAYFRALPWHNNNKKPARICWQFGDGQDTCINYPNAYTGQYVVAHNYQHTGLYEVCVNILYVGGCEAHKCKPIQVGERPDSCRADFERLPSPTADPRRAYFRALPWHNNNKKPARICWEFGDGNDTCINYTNSYTGQYVVAHNYQHRGLYEVCVKILYFGGCEARKCHPVQIGEPDSCSADFERSPIPGTTPLTVSLKALPWNNNNRKPSRVCWEFGDGRDTCINYPETYTGLYNVVHTYPHPGQYEVCVKIFYYGGCEARKCRPIVVPLPQTGCSVTLFEITPSITSLVRGFIAIPSSTPPRRPVRVCWYFGDGQDTCIMITDSLPHPNFTINHTYPGPGTYHACVSVLFEGGCLAYNCREVVILANPRVCGGYMTDSVIGPRTFKFKGFSIHAPNDQVIGYHWTFGDGTSANGQTVTHTYNQAGNYQVCLIITTQLGCETRICRPLHVAGTNQPILVLSPNPVINVLNVYFLSTHTEPVNIRIQNSTGTTVRTYVRNVTVGPNNWTHDLSSLVPGVYLYVVQSPNQLASAIFVKL
jgi:PKD repeat protein